MTPQRGGARSVGLLIAAAVLFLSSIYLFFPIGGVNASLDRLLADQGFSLSPQARKSLLPGLEWDHPLLSSDQGALLRCDRLAAQLRLLPLLTGRAVIGVASVMGGGRLEMELGLNGPDAVALSADSIQLSEIPFFKTVLGADVRGKAWSDGKLSRKGGKLSGTIRLEFRQLAFSGVRLGSFPLPDADDLRCQGMVRVADGRARLESLTLQGNGVFMRLSGDLPGDGHAVASPVNLTLEIMPKPEFLERQKLVFLLLARFATSPGVYRVPIRGTLLKPVIL